MLWSTLLQSTLSLAWVIGLSGLPTTSTPRDALDATTQHLHELLFLGITQKSAQLKAIPGIAHHWHSQSNDTVWTFQLRTDLEDHAGQHISPKDVQKCILSYFDPQNPAIVTASFPKLKSVSLQENTLTIQLAHPDPHLDINMSLIRFFRPSDAPNSPCKASNAPLWTSGAFQPNTLPFLFKRGDKLKGTNLLNKTPLTFVFAQSNQTLLFRALRKELDILFNTFTLSQSIWFAKHQRDYFRIKSTTSTVDYLAFNHASPILKQKPFRKAIAFAIPRKSYVKFASDNLFQLANSFLSPALSGYEAPEISFDLKKAQKILPEKTTLRYLTTSSSIGMERALFISSSLKKIGIQLKIETVETGIFFSKIRSGDFDLFASRWIGVSDSEIYRLTVHSSGPRNRINYKNPKMDKLIEKGELKKIEALFSEELPYLPLWFWHNELWIRKKSGLTFSKNLSLSGSWYPLLSITPNSSEDKK